jgi:hypothetical protein
MEDIRKRDAVIAAEREAISRLRRRQGMGVVWQAVAVQDSLGVLADYLEERGDPRAATVRLMARDVLIAAEEFAKLQELEMLAGDVATDIGLQVTDAVRGLLAEPSFRALRAFFQDPEKPWRRACIFQFTNAPDRTTAGVYVTIDGVTIPDPISGPLLVGAGEMVSLWVTRQPAAE